MTDREAFNLDETRALVYARAGYRCEHCGASIATFGTPQLAHRIPQTTRYLNLYGKAYIHHPLNLAATCSLWCNNMVDIRHDKHEIAALIARIKEAME